MGMIERKKRKSMREGERGKEESLRETDQGRSGSGLGDKVDVRKRV